MASWTTYRGMNVPDVSTGDAGDYLTDNFEELANRAAQANFAATTNPGAGDDIGDGYYPGSHWLNTTTDTMFICVDNTASAAVWQEIGSGSGDGTVSSVGLSLPGIFSVTGSPVTTSGTLTGSLANQSANEVFAGPSAGSPAAPTFRSLVTADFPDDGVTDAKLRNSAALSVIGRSSNSTGDPADIAAANDGEVLRRSGTSLGFGTIATAGIADDQVTFAKMQNVSSQRLIGRQAASSGDPTEITVAAGTGITVDWSTTDTLTLSSTGGTVTSVGLSLPAIFSVSGSPVTSSGTLTGSLANQTANQVFAGPSTGSATAPTFRSLVTADLPDDGVTDAKLRNSAALSVIGRASNSTGDPADIAAANDGEVLRRSGTSLAFGTIATAGIANDQITFAKMQNIATDHLIGRVSSGSGDPEEVVCTDLAQSLIAQTSATGMQAAIGVREALDTDRTYYVRHKVGTCAISNASPAVVTLTGHGLLADQQIVFYTTGTLPTGLTAGTIYYVKSPTANTFNIAASAGGSAINTSSAGSGTHSVAAGSDSNNGLSDSPTGAFLTLQYATDVVAGIDLRSHNVTIQCADSFYAAGMAVTAPWTGKGTVTLRGNTSTPSSCVINASTCISVTGFGRLTVTGFKLTSNSIGIYSESGQVLVGAMEFGPIAGFGVWVELGGQARFESNYTVSGNGSRHFYAVSGGTIFGTSLTVTTANTPAFSDAYAYAAICGVIQFQSITYTGTGATGKRYDSSYNGVIYTGGGTLPGSVAGSTSTGGQYQ